MKYWTRLNIIEKFSIISLSCILLMVGSLGIAINYYMKGNVLSREASLTADFVRAHVLTSRLDQEFYGPDSDARRSKFRTAFAEMAKIPGIANIIIYNRNGIIIWSPIEGLISKKYEENPDFAAASHGKTVVNLDISEKMAAPYLKEAGERIIEVYVPIYHKEDNYVIGVVGTYKTAKHLFDDIRRGTLIIWALTLIGGISLYMSLFWLFRRAYREELRMRGDIEQLNKELLNINTDLEKKADERTRQVIQMEKLSAVGEMMGEISHQLNNPMVGVVNYAQLAMRKIKKGVLPEKELETIEKAGSECKDIIQRLLAFYRHSSYEPVKTDINRLIEETIQLIGKQLSVKNIKIKTDYLKKLPDAMIDQALMKQVFFNIINNARQAMPDGGDLAIKSYLSNNVGREELCIEFSDTGSGIKKENLDQIFSPFFTTKSKEEGTGLGLSVAREIVVKHGGRIEVESEEGKGTAFYVKLPLEAIR